MSRLLIDEYPLLLQPEIATGIGLNESIILQQLHYWLQKSKIENDGKLWVYNTYEQWQKQFPFFSISRIRRTIKKLESLELIEIEQLDKSNWKNTNYYTINYEKFYMMFPQNKQSNIAKKNKSKCSNRTDVYKETETPAETNKPRLQEGLAFPSVNEIIVFGKTKDLSENLCNKFFKHYSNNGWIDDNKESIRNWQSLLIHWGKTEKTKEDFEQEEQQILRAKEKAESDRWLSEKKRSDFYIELENFVYASNLDRKLFQDFWMYRCFNLFRD